MTTREVLVAARALIDTPEKWIQGTWNLDLASGATCFCALGALREVVGGLAGDAFSLLCDQVPGRYKRGIARFNDAPTTTHADVMALFDRAIAACDAVKP